MAALSACQSSWKYSIACVAPTAGKAPGPKFASNRAFRCALFFKENPMAHKKVERKKELDRRRHRREQRLKQRIHEAQGKKA